MEFLIDTSVLIAATVKGDENRDRALSLLRRVEEPGLINTAIVVEYAGVIRRLTGPEAATSMTADLCRSYDYRPIPLSTVLGAVPHLRYGVGDAVIGQHAVENGWKLATLDRGFRRFVPENLLVLE